MSAMLYMYLSFAQSKTFEQLFNEDHLENDTPFLVYSHYVRFNAQKFQNSCIASDEHFFLIDFVKKKLTGNLKKRKQIFN